MWNAWPSRLVIFWHWPTSSANRELHALWHINYMSIYPFDRMGYFCEAYLDHCLNHLIGFHQLIYAMTVSTQLASDVFTSVWLGTAFAKGFSRTINSFLLNLVRRPVKQLVIISIYPSIAFFPWTSSQALLSSWARILGKIFC